MSEGRTTQPSTGLEIAIIGMAGRFPGAENIDAFWQNLRDGTETIASFSDEELLSSGFTPAMLHHPRLVKAGAILKDTEWFDAAFFGFSPREAEIMDPQHRLLLECAWEALEQAGYHAGGTQSPIGFYAGAGTNGYLINNLLANRSLLEQSVSTFQTLIGNDRDHLTTMISYKLNLKGPSITVQTACSTSLVAVHLACQGLLSGDCDLALAGGVSIAVPQKAGYIYEEGGIFSPDGHCRAFDADAHGTVGGSGLGLVVLKRLEDALNDHDHIHAVIKGSAINNDGAMKVGYTAPSIEGQAKVIRAAQRMAEVEADSITYIEAHGTGTSVGDPIEIAALTQAFRAQTERRGFCAIGSVKTNIGHLDPAAGIAGLLKTTLSLENRLIPASLHYERPNPKIDFANSPFFVNTHLSEWVADDMPRRAGVSSFGMGGTNVHMILEEAPTTDILPTRRPWQTLVLSAKTATAIEAVTSHLAQHLRQYPKLDLADVAFTLQVGRQAFSHRQALVCRDIPDAIAALENLSSGQVPHDVQEFTDRPVAFLFPGQGAQYVHMAHELYQTEPVFREIVDQCAELLQPHLGLDLRKVLYPNAPDLESATRSLEQTWLTQPALFTVEYALARLWMAWGIQPQAMIGHSIGEYVAACLAGVFSLDDALRLVAKRGQLIQSLPSGSMLAVFVSEQKIQAFLDDAISLAAVNGPELCVLSGPNETISTLAERLGRENVQYRPLHTSHAFHSKAMEPILEAFTEQVSQIALQAPQIPYLSNISGNWISVAEATDPKYWAKHIRQTVRFHEGVSHLLQDHTQVLLEVGPGRTLSGLLQQQAAEQIILSSTRHPKEQFSDSAFLMKTLGKLWSAGCPITWEGIHQGEPRQRVPLPTYPFERQRYWIGGEGYSGQHITQPDPSGTTSDQAKPTPENRALRLEEVASSHPRPALKDDYLAPRSSLEQQIVTIWQEFLGIAPIGVNDNFFELGGHSLLIVQITSRLREIYSVELPLSELFEAPTIAGLAAIIEQKQLAQTDDVTLAQILAEVQELSSEEVHTLLKSEIK